jgi:imidazolonepropionase
VAAAADAGEFAADTVVDGADGWLTPGLVDCHTHLVWGGSRVDEFERRLGGESYESIARSGGGIRATVRATRAAGEDELHAGALRRLTRLMEEGVTTVEIKSGYGLDTDTEMKLLRVARRLGESCPVTVRTTLLGAHAVPEEFAGRPDAYIDLVCSEMIPVAAAEGLADAVDAFCEGIGFSPAQCERVFTAAREHGLAVKAHAEQLSNLGGAVLASRHDALSVDHLEYLAPGDVAEIARAGTVAVLLPGAFHFLGETRQPPVDALRDAGVPLAVATDLNPGTSPLGSLLTAMNLACTAFGLTPSEALLGATRHGAAALGLDKKGHIAEGADADLCLWHVESPAELAWGINLVRPSVVWQAGRRVDTR